LVVTVVVDAVAGLRRVGVDVGVVFVAVQLTVGTRAGTETVAIAVLAGPFAPIHAGSVAPSTVVVDPVATDLSPVAVNPRVGVIAVVRLTGSPVAVAVLVDVAAAIAQLEDIAVTVLVDSVPRNVPCPRVDVRVGVVAVLGVAATGAVIAVRAGAKAVVVAIDTIGGAPQVGAVAVLVNPVVTNLRLPRVYPGVPIVAIASAAAGTPSEAVQVIVGAVAEAGRVSPIAVVVDGVSADLASTGVGPPIFVVAVTPIPPGIRVAGGVLVTVVVAIHTVAGHHAARAAAVTHRVAIGEEPVAVVVDVGLGAILRPPGVHVSITVEAISAVAPHVRVTRSVLIPVPVSVRAVAHHHAPLAARTAHGGVGQRRGRFGAGPE
jgi:hypothetical protein